MIRSSKFYFQYQTDKKTAEIKKICQEYNRLVNEYIPLFWNNDAEFNTATVHAIDSFLSSRYKSNACKQAYETCKSIWQQPEWQKENSSQPNFNGEMILDAKFVEINLDKPNNFDLWIRIATSVKYKRIELPCKRHRQFNKWLEKGKLKQAIAIKEINGKIRFRLFIDIPDKSVKQTGDVVGLDVGKNKIYYMSDGQREPGIIKNIIDKVHRRKYGSKRSKRGLAEIKNKTNQCLNKIKFDDIKVLVVEDIKDLKKNRKVGKLYHWSYPFIFEKLERLCQENCVFLDKVNPAYTSQTCSSCGYVNKANRSGEQWNCSHCGYRDDADHNASLNIRSRSLKSLNLHDYS